MARTVTRRERRVVSVHDDIAPSATEPSTCDVSFFVMITRVEPPDSAENKAINNSRLRVIHLFCARQSDVEKSARKFSQAGATLVTELAQTVFDLCDANH